MRVTLGIPDSIGPTITPKEVLGVEDYSKHIFADDVSDVYFTIQSNDETALNLSGGFVGPWAYDITSLPSNNPFTSYTTQAVLTSSVDIIICFNFLPLVLEALQFRISNDFYLYLKGYEVRGGSLAVRFRGCLYSPQPFFGRSNTSFLCF